MFIRILVVTFVISYFVWWINNRILGKNLKIARVITITLSVISIIYLIFGVLSYLIEEI